MAQRDLDDLLTVAFAMESNPGAYALLIGAGVSRSAGIPTAWDVINDMTAKLAQLLGESPADPLDWYENRFGEEPSYPAVLRRLGPTRFERQALLRKYFETSQESEAAPTPAPAHHAIADLVRLGVVKVIITLNFDRMIETALRQAGIEPVVVVTEPDIRGLAPLHTLACCIIHLHGDYLNPASMLNTDDELSQYSPERAQLLKRVLTEYGLIAVGWSGAYDLALRNAIASEYPDRFTFTWIEPAEQMSLAQDLRAAKKALLVRTDADQGLGRIADSVQSLRARRARNPLSLTTAVETAKRALNGGPVRIDLHDTLADEFRILHEIDDIKNPSGQADAPFDVILARIDEGSVVICGLIATLAFWGNDNTDKWWIGALHRFAIQGDGGGYTNLLERRFVAGVSMFYSAGVAAVASERFELLARLFSTSHHDDVRGKSESLAVVFRGDRISDRAANGISRPFGVIEPVLNEVFRTPKERIEDWWQRFEVLRSVHILLLDPSFQSNFEEHSTANTQWKNAKDGALRLRSEGRENEARDLDSRAAEGAAASGAAFDETVSRVRVGVVHVLAVDGGLDANWSVPVAQQLLAEVRSAGYGHPLMSGEFAPNPGSLIYALQAVDAAFGKAAHSRASVWGPIVQRRVWLDDQM